MKDFAFCTLTYGDKYLEFGDSLIKQINDLGYHIFVLTNVPKHYTESNLLTVVEYQKPYFSFHEKRIVMKECLKNYDSAIFLDADVFIKDVDNLDDFKDMSPGFHTFANMGNLMNTFLNDDLSPCVAEGRRNTKYGKQGLELLEKLGYRYKRIFHQINEGYLEHFLEGRWAIKKDGHEDRFFEIWDSLVDLCERIDIELGFTSSIGAGEGAVMSIAAYNSGMDVHSVSPLVSFINKHFISNYVEKMNNLKPWNIAG
jgi:hypothetical protein